MAEILKEKVSAFRSIVDIFDKKLAAALIVILFAVVYMQDREIGSLHKTIDENKDKMYEMVLQEVRKQTAPIKESQEKVSQQVDTMRKDIGGTLVEINNQVIKSKKK